MFGRKHAQQQMQTHRQQFMSELGESAHALRRAARHLAQGTAGQLNPTYERARHVAGRGWESTRHSISPMYEQMRENAMKARPMRRHKQKLEERKRSRMRTLRGLLLTGAAVGAATAAVARRRRQQAEWAEYEPMAGFDERRQAESKYGQRSAREKVASGAASMADNLSDRAHRIADTLHERSASMQEKASGGQQQHHDTGPVGASAVPVREPSGPSSTGPSATMGSSSSAMGPGPRSQPSSGPRERLGDPALDFPDER